MQYGFIKPLVGGSAMRDFGEYCQQIGVTHVRIMPIMYNSKYIETSYLAKASDRYYENYFIACDICIELNEQQHLAMYLKYSDNLCKYDEIYLHLPKDLESW